MSLKRNTRITVSATARCVYIPSITKHACELPNVIEELNQNNICLTVGSAAVADAYAIVMEEIGRAQKIHIKINSGMNRQGIQPDDAVE